MRISEFSLCNVVLAVAVAAGCQGCRSGSNDNGETSLYDRLEQAREISDPVEKATELIAVGNAYAKADESQWAVTSLKDAVEAADEINATRQATDRARVHIALAKAWQKVGSTSKCKDAYEETEKIVDKVESPADKTEILIDLASVKIKVDDTKDAKKVLKKAEEACGQIGDPRERASLLTWVAYGFAKSKDKAESARVLESAVQFANGQEKATEKSRLLAIIGRAQITDHGESDAGQANLDKALELARGIDDKEAYAKASALIYIADQFAGAGQKQKALELLSEAKDLVRELAEGKPLLEEIEAKQKKY